MPKTIIISRTDSLGDVVLTLPMAGVLKKIYPGVNICFIGRTYTQAIIETSEHVDHFINWDELSSLPLQDQTEALSACHADAIIHVFPNREIAKLAFRIHIPVRNGTSHRLFHWLWCNKMVPLGRKKSDLHESQLNLKLLLPLGTNQSYSLAEIASYYGLSKVKPLDKKYLCLLDKSRFNLILHPKSKGSGKEWRTENFCELIHLLPKDTYKIFISGTTDDGKRLTQLFEACGSEVTDITGQMSLSAFISFIHESDGLIAASTGPLHIAAALEKTAIGLFSPIRPMHPGRWSPVGKKASVLVVDKECNHCKGSDWCECMNQITPEQVVMQLEKSRSNR